MHDRNTVEYFNRNVCEYSLERMDHMVEVLQKHAMPGQTLADIGCGTGNTIEMLSRVTPIRDFVGVDPSENYVRLAGERNGCRTFRGSILDSAFIESIPERFDYTLLGAVLHHLVGRTRRQSRKNAVLAIRNAVSLLKPGGMLFIAEPAFEFTLAMDAVFYLKSLMTLITSERITIGSHWQNIGAPVVSYYSNDQLARMVRSVPDAELVDHHVDSRPVRKFPLCLLTRSNSTLVVRRRSGEPGENRPQTD